MKRHEWRQNPSPWWPNDPESPADRKSAPEYKRVQGINVGEWFAKKYRDEFWVGRGGTLSNGYWGRPCARFQFRVPRIIYHQIARFMLWRWYS